MIERTPRSRNSEQVAARQSRSRTRLFGKAGIATSVLGLALLSVFTQGSAASAATATLDTSSIQKLTNGLAWFALLTCIGGIVISASMWALGSKGQNAGTELIGKKGFIVCLTAAFFIGAVNPMIEFLDKKASSSDVDTAGVTKYTPYVYNSGGTGGSGSTAGAIQDVLDQINQQNGNTGSSGGTAGAIQDVLDQVNQQTGTTDYNVPMR